MFGKKIYNILLYFSPLVVITELGLLVTSVQNLPETPANIPELLNNCYENDCSNV